MKAMRLIPFDQAGLDESKHGGSAYPDMLMPTQQSAGAGPEPEKTVV